MRTDPGSDVAFWGFTTNDDVSRVSDYAHEEDFSGIDRHACGSCFGLKITRTAFLGSETSVLWAEAPAPAIGFP